MLLFCFQGLVGSDGELKLFIPHLNSVFTDDYRVKPKLYRFMLEKVERSCLRAFSTYLDGGWLCCPVVSENF